ncbi:MucBP domain-containing protein [Listeria grandensis]|uniref:MucBP domain-containing protein n=1 Tax=Listeria grandensis TaxID=1494963 RepID=UPI00164E10FF|nr:MucBP domain-containing protein [Listeria grandensis]MBC6314788.1 leucine-rich repeat protein [Listeria grandensis]
MKKIGVWCCIVALLISVKTPFVYAEMPQLMSTNIEKNSEAKQNQIKLDHFTYSYDPIQKTATIIGIEGFFADHILEEIQIAGETYTVTAIGDDVFHMNMLSGIDIPKTIQKIGDRAFMFNDITELLVTENVKQIGEDAFAFNKIKHLRVVGATDIGRGAFAANEISTLQLPDSIRKIADGTFASNRLVEVKLPKNLFSIGESGFAGNRLKKLDLPEGVETIGEMAFWENKLQEIQFPLGLRQVGPNAFKKNPDLHRYTLKGSPTVSQLKEVLDAQHGWPASGVEEGAVLTVENRKSSYTNKQMYYYLNEGQALDLEVKDMVYKFSSGKGWLPAVSWEKDGKILVGETEPTLRITMNKNQSEGVYQAIVDGQRIGEITVASGDSPEVQPVIVKHVDKSGNEIAAQEKLIGSYNNSYEAKPKVIAGYKVAEIPTNSKGHFSDKVQTVVIIYEAAEAKSITIHYVDEFGDNIISPKEVHGEYGESYDIQVQKIEGYQIWKAPVSMTRTFSEEKQIVTLQYATHVVPPNSTYRSLFKDVCFGAAVMTAAGDALLDGEVTQEKLDQIVKISAISDNWYTSLEGAQYLHHLKELFITRETSYLDSGDIQNLDGLSRSADLVSLYLPYQDIEDISGLKNLSNLTYLNLTDNEITDASPIAGLTKLEYISLDMRNNIQSLAPFRQLTNLKKLYLSASVSDFRPLQNLLLIQDEGSTWQLRGEVQLPDAYVGEPVFMQAFDPTGQQVAYGSVYLDDKWQGLDAYQNNQVIWTKQGTVGRVTFTQRPVGGTNSNRFISVVFKQRVLPAKATVQAVTVRYVDDQGGALAPEDRLTGVLGEAYTAQVKTIDGYQLTKEPANRVGSFSTEAQTVTFVYTKEAATLLPANSTYRSLFPDKKLAITVAKQIYPHVYFEDLDLDQKVTQEELNRVTEINENWDITDNPMREIEGVQYLHNLKRLSIGDGVWSGFVENLDRLAGLDKLEELSIVKSRVQDISGIKNLTNLRYLDLSDNNITDASPIAGLTKLEYINLDMENNIQSLAPFRQLTNLKKLYLTTSVSDFRPLQHLPLIQDASNTWELRSEVQLPDAYVGEPVFMQAFDPFGDASTYGSVKLDGKLRGGKYTTPYMRWEESGEKGQVTFQGPKDGASTGNFMTVVFKQRVLPAKATVQPVTVRYVDEKGEFLAPEERLTGVLGEAYEAQAKTINGYQLTEEPINRVGTFGTEAQTVTFVYTKEAIPVSQAVTVRHLDTNGKVLAPEEVLTGALGDTYEAEAQAILGYRLVTTPANQTGTFGTEAQTVTFIYAQETVPPMAQPVTVQYVDDQGQALTQEETLIGAFGAPYQAEVKTISGYQLTSLPSNHTGTFQAVAQTVRFVYTKQALPVVQPVTVQHVDTQGKAVAEEDILQGHAGETYHAKAKVIPGYHVSQHPANATGIFGPSAQTVRFVYALDEPIEAIDPVEEGHTTPPKPSLTSPVTEDTRTPTLPLPTRVSSEVSPSVVPVVPGPTLPSLGDRTTHSIGWGLTLLLVGTWLFLRPRYQANKRKGAKFK